MSGFERDLRLRLQQPLPGARAQKEMSARHAGGGRIKFNHSGPPKQGGVTLLLYPKEKRWFLPLTKRPAYLGIHSGQISFPGGKMESQDHDLIATALRETVEEIGVNIDRERVIGTLSPLYIIASHYQVLPIVALLHRPPAFVLDPREVDSLIEVEIDILLDPGSRKEKDLMVRGTEIRAPYFDVNQEIVWGATAMMLNEFLTLIKEVDLPRPG